MSASTRNATTPPPIQSNSFIRIRLNPPKLRAQGTAMSCRERATPLPVYVGAEAGDVNGLITLGHDAGQRAEISPRNKVRIGQRHVDRGERAASTHENGVIIPLVGRGAALLIGSVGDIGLDQPALPARQQEACSVPRGRDAAAVIQLAGAEEAPGAHVPIGDEPALGRRGGDNAAASVGGDRADIVVQTRLASPPAQAR